MKKSIALLCVLALLQTGTAVACELVNKRTIQVGTSEGVAGECANNGAPVQCINNGEGAGRFSCDGPQGGFSGPNLQALIVTACGCSAADEDDASQQLQQEMDD